MKLHRLDVATALIIVTALGQFAATPAFPQALNSIAHDPWPLKVSAALAIIGGVGALVVARLTPSPSGNGAALPTPTSGTAAEGPATMTLLQDLGLVEVALGDVAAFAAGQPVSGSAKIGNTDYTCLC